MDEPTEPKPEIPTRREANQQARQEREAEALRRNLLLRKQQTRQREAHKQKDEQS